MPIQPANIPVSNPGPQVQPYPAGAVASIGMQGRQLKYDQSQLPFNQTQQALKTALDAYSQMQNNSLQKQSLAQQAPVQAGEAALLGTQVQGAQNEQYWKQPVSLDGSGTPTTSGTSPNSPPPGSGMPPASGSASPQGNAPPGGGLMPQMPMGIMAGGGIPSGPQQNMSPAGGGGGIQWTGDHTQDFMAWKQAQQGGQSGPGPMTAGMGQPAPQGPPQGQPQAAPSPMAGMMVPRGQLYGIQNSENAYKAEASILSGSPQFQSVFGKHTPEELIPMLRGAGEPGTLTKGLMDLAGTQNKLNYDQNKFTTTEQNKVKTDANKEFGDFTNDSQAIATAQKSLADSKKNPAMFNIALANIAKVVGIQSRKPQAVAEYIADSDPSLAGKINAFISTKGAGQLPTDLYNGLQGLMNDRAASAKSTFETKAQARIAQNAQMFGGDQGRAAQGLYPGYDFSGGRSAAGSQMNSSGTPRLGAGDPVITVKTSDGKTQQIYASKLAMAKQRDAGLQVMQ